MLSEFEQQFRTTLRTRLPAEIRDHVQVATGSTNQKGILVGIRSAEPVPEEFGSVRSEIAPGVNVPRRVARLRCMLDCSLVPVNGSQDRAILMTWLGQILYLLDDSEVRTGTAFTSDAADPGFLIQSMKIEGLESPFEIHANEPDRLQLSLTADGWFWPVGEPGQAGVEIGEIRIRGAIYPLLLTPANPVFVANGPALNLTISFDARGTSRITASGLDSESFGNLAARLEKEDGTAGAGILSGGTPGDSGIRLLPVTDDHVELIYTPPAIPGKDILLLSIDDNESSNGLDIARFTLVTGAAS